MSSWWHRRRNEVVRREQRLMMVESHAAHPTTLTVLVPQLEAAALPECWCGQRAVLQVLLHKLDSCEDEGLSRGTGEHFLAGAEIMFACRQCYAGIQSSAARSVERRLELITDGSPLFCLTCGLEVTGLHSIIDLLPLMKGASA